MTKRILLTIVGVFLTVFIALFLIGSSGNLPREEYEQVRQYLVPPRKEGSDTLTVMTYNVGYLSGMTNNLPVARSPKLSQNNLDKAQALLTQLSPDFVGIQEIDFRSARSYHVNQLVSLANSAGYPYAFQSVNWDKRYVPFPYWPPSRHFGGVISGQAILSGYPLKRDTTIRLVKPLNSSLIYNAFYLDRLVQIATADVNGTAIKIMNVHLEAFDEETRVSQAETLVSLYNQLSFKMPVLLIGDFNSRPSVEDSLNGAMVRLSGLDNLKSAISNETYQSNPDNYYTFNSRDPYQMIDYIFYNPNFIEMIEARVVHEASEISDHLPVIMKFRFKN